MTYVIVQGMFVVEPGERDRFIEASIEGMRASRAEAGCLEYVFASDPLDPGRVVLSERWESMELLQQHLNGQVRGRPARIGEGRPRRCGWEGQELFLKVTVNFDPLSERALLV
jgi:quinol monooxygenase YgiN